MRLRCFAQVDVAQIAHLNGNLVTDHLRIGRFTFLVLKASCSLHNGLCRIYDQLMRAMVFLHKYTRRRRRHKVAIELHEELRRAASPSIDTLPVIPHGHQRSVSWRPICLNRQIPTLDLGKSGPDPGDGICTDVLEFVDK
ncbi:hypothetical protein D3C86_1555270 [compost metagenome]